MPRSSAPLDFDAGDEFLEPLHADDDEGVRLELAVFDLTVPRRLSEVVEQRRQRRFAQTHRLDLDLAALRGPAAADTARAALRQKLHRQSKPGAGCGIVEHPPAQRLLRRLGGGVQHRALVGAEHAGFLGAVALLERLGGGERQGVAILHAAGVKIVQQGKIGLHGTTFAIGNGRIVRRQRRRARAFRAGLNFAARHCAGRYVGGLGRCRGRGDVGALRRHRPGGRCPCGRR